MATYEIYQGGSRQQNNNFAMFPAAPFVASTGVDPVVKQLPAAFFISRTLNLGQDTALQDYAAQLSAAGTAIVSADEFGMLVIPTSFLAVGFYWSVNAINAGGTFSVDTRGGVTLLTTTSTGTLASGYVPWPSAPQYYTTSDIIDMTLPTVPAGGLGSLSVTVGVYGIHFRHSIGA